MRRGGILATILRQEFVVWAVEALEFPTAPFDIYIMNKRSNKHLRETSNGLS